MQPFRHVMPVYRLQTVLGLRERAKEAAEQAFVEAQASHKRAQDELQRMQQELEQRKRERKAKVEAYFQEVMKSGAGVGGLSIMNRFEDRLKDEEAELSLEIENQKESVKEAKDVMEKRRWEMAEAAKELKAIEKHRESWAKQVKEEREKREELTQEEIGNALHLAKTRKGDLG